MASVDEKAPTRSTPPVVTGSRGRLVLLALFATAAVASFYLLLFVITAAVVGVTVAAVILAGRGGVVILSVLGILLAATYRSLIAAVPRRPQMTPAGVAAHRDSQAKLWRLVDGLAARLGIRTVDALRLTWDDTAAAAEHGAGLLWRARRELYLPVSYLVVLTSRELEGVVAHELAHFAAGDAALSRWLAWWQGAVGRTLGELEKLQSVLRYPFRFYARLMARAAAILSRRSELAADAASARLFGPEVIGRSLRMTRYLDVAFSWYWEEVRVVLDAGYRPPIVEGFRIFLGSQGVQDRLAQLPDETDAFSSHPSLKQRLAAVGSDVEAAAAGDDPLAITLVNDVGAIEHALLRQLAGEREGDLQPLVWQHAALRVLTPVWRERLRACDTPTRGLRVSDAPRLLTTAATQAADAQAATEDRTVELLCAFTLTLLDNGWTLERMPGHLSILRRNGNEVVPYEMIDELATGEMGAAEWSARCRELGIGDLELVNESPAAMDADAPRQQRQSLSDARTIRLLMREPSITGFTTRAGVGLAVIIGVPAGLAALFAHLSDEAPSSGHAVVRVIGVLILAALGWLLWRRHVARENRPAITLADGGLTIRHDQLLREPLQIPRPAIRVIVVDDGERSPNSELRFPVYDDSPFASHNQPGALPRGYVWPSVKGRVPLYCLEREAPNVLVLLDHEVGGPRVKRERLHGPLNGERIRALAICLEEPAALQTALQAQGLARNLTLSDIGVL